MVTSHVCEMQMFNSPLLYFTFMFTTTSFFLNFLQIWSFFILDSARFVGDSRLKALSLLSLINNYVFEFSAHSCSVLFYCAVNISGCIHNAFFRD